MAFQPTKKAVDVYAPTTADGKVRTPVLGEAATYHTEFEVYVGQEVEGLRQDITAAAQGAKRYETWALLSTDPGTATGQPAEVTGAAPADQHVDPVSGLTVDDNGQYRWSAAPAGWTRTGDLVNAEAVTTEVEEARSGSPTLKERLDLLSAGTFTDDKAVTAVRSAFYPTVTSDPEVALFLNFKDQNGKYVPFAVVSPDGDWTVLGDFRVEGDLSSQNFDIAVQGVVQSFVYAVEGNGNDDLAIIEKIGWNVIGSIAKDGSRRIEGSLHVAETLSFERLDRDSFDSAFYPSWPTGFDRDDDAMHIHWQDCFDEFETHAWYGAVGQYQRNGLALPNYVIQQFRGAGHTKFQLVPDVGGDDHDPTEFLINPRPNALYPLSAFVSGHVPGNLIHRWTSRTFDAKHLEYRGAMDGPVGQSYCRWYFHPTIPERAVRFGRSAAGGDYRWAMWLTEDGGDTVSGYEFVEQQNLYFNPVWRSDLSGFDLFFHVNPQGLVDPNLNRLVRMGLTWDFALSSAAGGALGTITAPGFVPLNPWIGTNADTIYTPDANHRYRMTAAWETAEGTAEIALGTFPYSGDANDFQAATARMKHVEVDLTGAAPVSTVADICELGDPMSAETAANAYIGGGTIAGAGVILTCRNNAPSDPGVSVTSFFKRQPDNSWLETEVERSHALACRPITRRKVVYDADTDTVRYGMGTRVAWVKGNTGSPADYGHFDEFNTGVQFRDIRDYV